MKTIFSYLTSLQVLQRRAFRRGISFSLNAMPFHCDYTNRDCISVDATIHDHKRGIVAKCSIGDYFSEKYNADNYAAFLEDIEKFRPGFLGTGQDKQ